MEPKTLLKILFYGTVFILIMLLYVPTIDLFVDQTYYEEYVMPPTNNEYAIDEETSAFVGDYLVTDSFLANSRQDLWQIIFTTINSGTNNFTFYCAQAYEECFNDLYEVTSDKRYLSYFNNFVHPYNNFKAIEVQHDSRGPVDLHIKRLYSENEIEKLNAKIDNIWAEKINPSMNQEQIIRTIHDNILNNSDYDQVRADAIGTEYEDDFEDNNSHRAIGPLIEGKGICGGYSDAMSLFLYKMDIPNYRISNEMHIWNYLKLDGEWLHLDLTWNNPTTDQGRSIIITTYFLITTDELRDIDDSTHHYEREVFMEAQ